MYDEKGRYSHYNYIYIYQSSLLLAHKQVMLFGQAFERKN